MDRRSPFFVPVLTGHAISTLVQSISWFILSIICFFYYSEKLVIKNVEPTYYRNSLEKWMYELYLNKKYNIDSNIHKFLNITPKVFMSFCSVYFILSVILTSTSVIVIYNLRKLKDRRLSLCKYCIFFIWIISGLVQSLVDLIFFALLLDDYSFYANQRIINQQMGMIPTAIGVVMTIVARGFIMWFVNLAMDATSMCLIIQQQRKESDFKQKLFPPMQRNSTLRRSMTMSEDQRTFPSDERPSIADHSNDGYFSDRCDQYPIQTPPQSQTIRRSSSLVARFNPPPQPGAIRRSYISDNRFDNGYAPNQVRMRYSSSGDGSGMRSDSNFQGSR